MNSFLPAPKFPWKLIILKGCDSAAWNSPSQPERSQTRFWPSNSLDSRINPAVLPYSVSNLVVFLHPNLWRVSLGASSISGYSFISQPAAALTSSPPDSALSMWEFQSKSPVMKNLNAGFPMKQDQYQSSWEPDKLVPIRWALCSAFVIPERDSCWKLSFCTTTMVLDAGSSCIGWWVIIPSY